MLNEDILNDLDSLEEESNYLSPPHQLQQQLPQPNSYNLPNSSKSLLEDKKFVSHMQTINLLLDQKIDQNPPNPSQYFQDRKNFKQYPGEERKKQAREGDKQLIHRSNQYAEQIDREINMLFRASKTLYNQKFPELQSIVTKPALYCKAVSAIQSHLYRMSKGQASSVDQLKLPFLSSHQAISLKISISSLHNQLSPEQQKELQALIQKVLILHEHHNALMIYLQSSMQIVAPNLCQLVGSAIASKLISGAGGLDKLANMPACNVQVLGGHRSAQVGFGVMERNHTGIFSQMDLVRDAPKKFQMQLVRMLASNTVKCAKADILGSRSNLGAKFREDMFERFQKIQEEGGLLRSEQPLPVPDQQPKKKRGGKRHRKMRELYQMSQLHKNQNRLKFGQEAEDQIGQEGQGLGMLGKASGKLKVNIKKQKVRVSKKMSQRMSNKSGMESTLDIGSKQGIQLINPQACGEKGVSGGTLSYFAKQSGFRTIMNNKLGKQ